MQICVHFLLFNEKMLRFVVGKHDVLAL